MTTMTEEEKAAQAEEQLLNAMLRLQKREQLHQLVLLAVAVVVFLVIPNGIVVSGPIVMCL